jgi:PTS system galactitol-specific IIA component
MDIFSAEVEGPAQTMLERVSARLRDLGYVNAGYAAALIEREGDHPTGLELAGPINAAIPHTDAQHVLQPAIVVIMHPRSHFLFRRMDEPSESIPVHVVFLLVVKDPSGYMKLLSDLAKLLQDADFAETLHSAQATRVAQELQSRLAQHGAHYVGPLTSDPHVPPRTPRLVGQESQ